MQFFPTLRQERAKDGAPGAVGVLAQNSARRSSRRFAPHVSRRPRGYGSVRSVDLKELATDVCGGL
jgi:hypothetical protein